MSPSIKKLIYLSMAVVIIGIAALGFINFKKSSQTATTANLAPLAANSTTTTLSSSAVSFIAPAGNENIHLDKVFLIKWDAGKTEGNYYLFDSVLQGDGWHVNPSTGKLGQVNIAGGQYVWQLGLKYNLGIHKLVLADTSNPNKLSGATKYESKIFCIEGEYDVYNSLCKKTLQDYQNSKNNLISKTKFDLGSKDPSGLSQSHIDEFSGSIKGWAYDANQYMQISVTLANADNPEDTFTYNIDSHVSQTSQYVLTQRPDIEDYLKKLGAQNTENLANFLISSSQFTHPGKWKIQSATFNGHAFGIPTEAEGVYTQQ